MVISVSKPDNLSPAAAPQHIYAETMKSQLQGRYLGGLVNLGDRMWRIVLLQSGRLLVRDADQELEYTAPCVFWRVPNKNERFFLCAGSSCEQVIVDEVALANAIGHKPEAAALRVFSSQSGSQPLANQKELQGDLARNFLALKREYAARGVGSETIIEAHVRVILVLLWREFLDTESQAPVVATRALILLRFRQSVESHFRDRWTVKQHANELNVSTDRLHDICSATLGMSPQQLIQNRLADEARLLLERSEMTLDQLSVYLGFKNSPQFNVFFKLHYGKPPGKYRQDIRVAKSNGEMVTSASHADWP